MEKLRPTLQLPHLQNSCEIYILAVMQFSSQKVILSYTIYLHTWDLTAIS